MAEQQRARLQLKELENQQLREYLAQLTEERERVSKLRAATQQEFV